MKLSENRAKAFAAYMKDKEDMPASLMKVNWEGEDWIGLRQAVKASNLSNRDEILKVLEVSDINKRKAQLKALNGGKTYRMLLDDYYPALRRIDYTLAYIARPFDVNEAKQVIKTKPQYLSLNEMFLVANTYPKESAEFKEVFDIAVRLYPFAEIVECLLILFLLGVSYTEVVPCFRCIDFLQTGDTCIVGSAFYTAGLPGIASGKGISVFKVSFESIIQRRNDAVWTLRNITRLDAVERTRFRLLDAGLHLLEEVAMDGTPRHSDRTLDYLDVLSSVIRKTSWKTNISHWKNCFRRLCRKYLFSNRNTTRESR